MRPQKPQGDRIFCMVKKTQAKFNVKNVIYKQITL